MTTTSPAGRRGGATAAGTTVSSNACNRPRNPSGITLSSFASAPSTAGATPERQSLLVREHHRREPEPRPQSVGAVPSPLRLNGHTHLPEHRHVAAHGSLAYLEPPRELRSVYPPARLQQLQHREQPRRRAVSVHPPQPPKTEDPEPIRSNYDLFARYS